MEKKQHKDKLAEDKQLNANVAEENLTELQQATEPEAIAPNEETTDQPMNLLPEESAMEIDEEEETFDDEEKEEKTDKLNLTALLKAVKSYWWMILLNCLIIGGIAALLIIEEPRTYLSEVKLAPEAEDISSGGSLSSIASSFGIDLGGVTTSDAIRPDLYPDLVASNDFVYRLFKIPVKSLNGNIYTDYYTYLTKYQKVSWWRKELNNFQRKFQDEPKDEPAIASNSKPTFYSATDKGAVKLTRRQEKVMEAIRSLVSCNVDKRTYVISISVVDQDPLIAATVADSVKSMLQNFITDYRTKKATKDYEYYYSLLKQAKKEYEQSCQAYARYVDSHRDVILQAYISERDQLENDMQLKLNTYNAMLTQAQNAKAKIQENTPAFTILQNAFVPVKPIGPKRMIFVLTMVFLTFVFTSLVIVLKKLH